jgi:hypothetical protein
LCKNLGLAEYWELLYGSQQADKSLGGERRSLRHLLEGLFGLRGSGRFQKRHQAFINLGDSALGRIATKDVYSGETGRH